MYSVALLNEISSEIKKLFQCKDLNIVWTSEEIQGDPQTWGLYTMETHTAKVRVRGDILLMIETLCHEVVHFWQHRNGSLSRYWSNGVPIIRWQGEEFAYRKDDGICMSSLSGKSLGYRDWPWEKEAFELQSELFFQFCTDASRKLLERLQDIALGQY